MEDIMRLCDQVRETSYAIHVYHGNGYLEKVYENALVSRLRKAGFSVKQQRPITIHDEDGTVIGRSFFAFYAFFCGEFILRPERLPIRKHGTTLSTMPTRSS